MATTKDTTNQYLNAQIHKNEDSRDAAKGTEAFAMYQDEINRLEAELVARGGKREKRHAA